MDAANEPSRVLAYSADALTAAVNEIVGLAAAGQYGHAYKQLLRLLPVQQAKSDPRLARYQITAEQWLILSPLLVAFVKPFQSPAISDAKLHGGRCLSLLVCNETILQTHKHKPHVLYI